VTRARASARGFCPLPYVFDRFRQADQSTTRAQGGLGLGLSIVRHLVELHGGEVSAHSEGEGRGATFTVRLPLTQARSEGFRKTAGGADAEPHAASDPRSDVLGGVRVLVVDDEPDARALLAALLGRRGARVVTASSAAEALPAVAALRPDVLVSDIGMGGEDGYELIRRVRALPAGEGGRTPALALTAYARAEDRARALAAGFQAHLAKPIEPAELAAAVASLAGRSTS
jgi:CheY-like chemotaxis protein